MPTATLAAPDAGTPTHRPLETAPAAGGAGGLGGDAGPGLLGLGAHLAAPPLLVADSVRVGDGVRCLTRSDGTLQLGLRPEHAVRVRRARSTVPPRIHEDPPRSTDPRMRAEHAALALRLGSAGARSAVRRRAGARVDVLGDADLADPLAEALRAAGIGHVRRAAAAGHDQWGAGIDLVIRCVLGLLTPESVEDLVRLGDPHLVVGVVEGAGTVGPLVLPGRTACLRCHQRALADADPEWPVLAMQAAVRGPAVEACSAVTAAHVVAVAAEVALRCVDSVPGTGRDTPPAEDRPALPDPEDDAAAFVRHVGEPLDPVRVERILADPRCGCVRR